MDITIDYREVMKRYYSYRDQECTELGATCLVLQDFDWLNLVVFCDIMGWDYDVARTMGFPYMAASRENVRYCLYEARW